MAFESFATTLVSGDTNDVSDIFVHDRSDADDEIDEASSLATGSTVRGVIAAANDVDLYRFNAEAGQLFEIDIDVPDGVLDSEIRVFSGTGVELAMNDNDAGPAPEFLNLFGSARESFLSFTAPLAGTYYLGLGYFLNDDFSILDGTGDIGYQGSGFAGTTTARGGYEIVVRPTRSLVNALPMSGDRAGFGVSVSGDIAVVGERLSDVAGFSNAGAVSIYGHNGDGSWQFVRTIVSPIAHAQAHFGHAVSVSGDVLLVGEETQNANGFRSGAIHFYGRDEGGTCLLYTSPSPRDS